MNWKPFFDPYAFTYDHKNPKLDDFRLTSDELKAYGIEVTRLRKTFNDKADAMEPSDREEELKKVVTHTRKGLTYSTKATNP